MRSRVELFEAIRRDHRLEPGLSIRQLAHRHGVHRRTVRQALASAIPPPRRSYPRRRRPAIDPWREVIDAILIADTDAPAKQRHTARRIWQRLVAEHGARVAEVTVSRYVAARRAELGLDAVSVFVPQQHPPGEEAEVDFGEFWFDLTSERVRVWLFVMRLSHSGRAFHYAYGTQAQEAFLEGHVRAFVHFGGVPGRIRYDNLTAAVLRVAKGRTREETQRFMLLRSHYGFDSFFTIPGKDGAHEKGGVEGEIGRFRRRHLVPVPKVASFAALNENIAAADRADDARVITGRTVDVGTAFLADEAHLRPLPDEAFDAAITLTARVDNRARVSVRGNYYSVPARYAGRRLLVRLGAATVSVHDGTRVVAVHERACGRAQEVLALDHYLEVLTRKPGALPGATALAQARAAGVFTTAHQRYWDAARAASGDAAGTRALIQVLLAHRTLPAHALTAAMTTAVATGILAPDAVIIDARRHTRTGHNDDLAGGGSTGEGADDRADESTVVGIGALRRYDRPAPSLTGYDTLLTAKAATP